MPADHSLISVTAKLAAYYRQFSDIPFAREVAERIGAEAAFEQILRAHGTSKRICLPSSPRSAVCSKTSGSSTDSRRARGTS